MSVDRPWQPEVTFRYLLGLFVSMSLGWLVAALVGVTPEDRFWAFLISTLSFHAAAVGLTHWFVREHGASWGGAFGFNAPGALGAILLAMLVTLGALPCAWILGQLSAYVMSMLDWQPAVQEAVVTLQSSVNVPEQLYMGGAAVLLVPVAEELIFRGILYPTVKGMGWPRLAFWGTSVLFGAVHMTGMTFIPLTFLGICLAWLYERTGNLLAPIFAHSFFNLVNLILLVASQQ